MDRSASPFTRCLGALALSVSLALPLVGAAPATATAARPSREPLPPDIAWVKRDLTITGHGDNETINVDCYEGKVRVNFEDQSFRCQRVKTLKLLGKGGDDYLEADIFPADFTSLTQVTMNGGPGGDNLDGWPKRDVMIGGPGDDDIGALGGRNLVDGGKGYDTAYRGVGNVTATPKVLKGNGRDDISGIEEVALYGSAGNDVLDARKWTGPATLNGYGGADTIYGSNQADSIDGGSGDDTVVARKGDDFFFHTGGNDTLKGGPGHDSLQSGVGGTGKSATVTDTQITNTDIVGTATLASIEDITVFGNTGSGVVVNAAARTKAITIRGSAGPDILSGGSGNDTITGYLGDDTLNGNAGDDFINGQQDTDTANGGPDHDTCIAEIKSGCEV